MLMPILLKITFSYHCNIFINKFRILDVLGRQLWLCFPSLSVVFSFFSFRLIFRDTNFSSVSVENGDMMTRGDSVPGRGKWSRNQPTALERNCDDGICVFPSPEFLLRGETTWLKGKCGHPQATGHGKTNATVMFKVSLFEAKCKRCSRWFSV